MLNKRVKTLLTLMLAGAMVLSEPAASWASGEETAEIEETTESQKSSDTESEKEEKAEGKKDEKTGDKKKKVSGNAASSNKGAGKASADKAGKDLDKVKDPEAVAEKEAEAPKDAEDGPEAAVPESAGPEAEETIKPSKSKFLEEVPADDGEEENKADEKRARVYENLFNVEGGSEGTDYSFDPDTGVLTISTNRKMTLSSVLPAASNSISVNSPMGATLALEKLQISTSNNSAINIMSTGQVDVDISGQNGLVGADSSIQGNVTIDSTDGTGILSGSPIKGTVTVKGGNILMPVEKAVDVDGKTLVRNAGTLSANTTYSVNVSGNEVKNYKNGIRSDVSGNVVMYLPTGYEVKARGTVLNVSKPASTTTPPATDTPKPNTPTPEQPYKADEADNVLYMGANSSSQMVFNAGQRLEFYAAGAGYGPEEPQEVNDPIDGSTRYIPSNWNVSTTSSSVSGNNSASGKWNKDKDMKEKSGQYRYEGSFQLSPAGLTTTSAAVGYTLRVNYERETYRESKGDWVSDGTVAYRTQSFSIRGTATPTVRPTSYVRSTVTTSALRSNVSSNARNATTSDETPIGTMVLLLIVAGISGTVIFRKKRIG